MCITYVDIIKYLIQTFPFERNEIYCTSRKIKDLRHSFSYSITVFAD